MNLFEMLILGAFAKLIKATIILVFVISVRLSMCPSVCPSVRKQQLDSRWTYFHKILYLSIFSKLLRKLNFYQDITRITSHQESFTPRPKYIYDII